MSVRKVNMAYVPKKRPALATVTCGSCRQELGKCAGCKECVDSVNPEKIAKKAKTIGLIGTSVFIPDISCVGVVGSQLRNGQYQVKFDDGDVLTYGAEEIFVHITSPPWPQTAFPPPGTLLGGRWL